MDIKVVSKNIGIYLLSIGGILILLLIGTFFILGSVWVSDKIQPILQVITTVAFLFTIVILLPLFFIRKTRGIAAIGLLIVSYAFGLDLWTYSALISYQLWGISGLVIGLFLGGIGVVPIAMLAAIFNGWWIEIGNIALLLLLTFGARFLSAYLIVKHEEPRVAIIT